MSPWFIHTFGVGVLCLARHPVVLCSLHSACSVLSVLWFHVPSTTLPGSLVPGTIFAG